MIANRFLSSDATVPWRQGPLGIEADRKIVPLSMERGRVSDISFPRPH